MLVFWIVVFVLLVLVLALLLPALLRPNVLVKTDANAEKRAIFRQQFEELAQDKGNGVLDETQYALAKSDLERRLLTEADVVSQQATSVKPDKILAGIILLAFPVLAILLYASLGNPLAIISPLTTSQTQTGVAHETTMADLEKMLATLQQKLEKNPQDAKGWTVLARSYMQLKRYAEAEQAYEKVTQLVKDDAQLYADYAEASALAAGSTLIGKPEALIQKALAIDPQHIKTLLLKGSLEFERKTYDQAIVDWESALKLLPADALEMKSEVRAMLTEANKLSASAQKNGNAQTGEPQASGISGAISLSPKLAGKIDPAATLFIYARAPQGAPMPLAILRATAGELPYSFKLDDNNSVMAERKLSQASEVVLVARISKSGNAQPQSGDLQGSSAVIKPDAKEIKLVIDQVLP
ncbi:MAG: c-type cytochrome biogenesis protein CcmI [Methylophilaceae bacterium]|nr:c-type cytochrome biogenesis protein CcmI [Methylophilaceae bacterium]